MLGVKQNEEKEGPPHQITAEEEALKRNTDCVYFLASPLTCKKGIECEYRHSDIARLNPQDCYFWLNGNCLNPKCAFRHPPLDGLLGTQVTTSLNSLPPSHTMVPVSSQGLNVPGKQSVPCIFFQKGYCLKGDMCPFMHGPYSLNNKATQSAGATPVPESQPNKKTFGGGLGNHTQVQKLSQGNAPKSANLPTQEKSADVLAKVPLRNRISTGRSASIATGLDNELPQYRPGNVHSFSNGNLVSRSNRNHQVHIVEDQSVSNVKDADEVSRELSPGFDVLVDDELMDSEYYPDEDQFGRSTGHNGMNLNASNEYENKRSGDYGPVADVDRDLYDKRNYDSFERLQGHSGRDVQRSSERVLGGPAYTHRRRYPRADSPGQINGSDLRHHLAKQKRNTGLRSIISRDRTLLNSADDRSFQAPRRDLLPTHDTMVSSRLQGRIKLPGRSASPIPPLSENEIDRARNRSRLSAERPLGRLRDRIKGRVQEDFINDRNFRGSRIRRDIVDDNNAAFSGPKSLSELKVAKTSEIYEKHPSERMSHGKRKYQKLEEGQLGEGDASFEGPMPLSEILKRKRGGNVVSQESGSTTAEEHNQMEIKQHLMIPTEAKESNDVLFSAAKNEGSIPAAGKVVVTEGNNKLHEGQPSLQRSTSEVQIEDGMIGDEAFDQKGDDFDYDEQADGKDYNLDDGENGDPEDDYFDEDDDADDFAKKMGVVFS
ncbi:hypothetical protein ACET3Z_032176 [Daucus carota]